MSTRYQEFSLKQVRNLTGGDLFGDPEIILKRISFNPVNSDSEELCLVLSSNLLALVLKKQIKAGAFLVPEKLGVDYEKKSLEGLNFLRVRNPKLALKLILDQYGPPRIKTDLKIDESVYIHDSACLGKSLRVGANAHIGKNTKIGDYTEICAGAYIGNHVQLGKNCLIKPNVVIEDHSVIGNNVIIHSGAVIGADGFSFITEKPATFERFNILNAHKVKDLPETEKQDLLNQEHLKVKSVGFVLIEDNVEIGSNTCIDRGTLGPTKIGRGTKIDNLVQIGHNCTVGENCLIVGCSGLGGSVNVKKGVVFAAGSGSKDSVTIGEGALVAATSQVNKNVEDFEFVIGTPAVPAREFINREKMLRKVLKKKSS